MDPSDAVEVWDCPYVLIWESVTTGMKRVLINTRVYVPISESVRMGHEKGSYKCLFCSQYLWQRVWLRPLEVVRHWNDVCLHLQSCRQLSSEIVVFLNLRVVWIRKEPFRKEAFKQGLQGEEMLARLEIIFVFLPGRTHWEAELEGSDECPEAGEREWDFCSKGKSWMKHLWREYNLDGR